MRKANLHFFTFLFLIGILFSSCDETKTHDNQLKNETVVEYHSNGRIKSMVPKKGDKRNGLARWFYENGNLEIESVYKEGNQIGECIYYYKEGGVKSYNFYTLNSDLKFQLNYNENGSISAIDGKPFYLVYDSKKDSLRLKESTLMHVYLATPKEFDISLETFDTDGNEELYLRDSFNFVDKMPAFDLSYNEVGSKVFTVVSTLRNDKLGVLKKDTISISLKVI